MQAKHPGGEHFKAGDKNNDGFIDATEYREVSKTGHHSEQHCKVADANKDGFLGLTEFTAHAEHKLTVLESGQPKKNRDTASMLESKDRGIRQEPSDFTSVFSVKRISGKIHCDEDSPPRESKDEK